MASLVIKFADLSQEPVGSGNDVTAEVLVSYTREVPLTDGTVLQAVPTRKQLGAGGTAIFEVTPSDDPTVQEAHRGFGLRVEWLLTHRVGRGRQTETRGSRTVKVLTADGATVQFGRLLPAEDVGPQYATVGELLGDVTAVYATVDNLAVTATSLDYGQEATATISGASPWKTIEVGIPKGMPDSVGAQLVADSQTTTSAAQQAAIDVQTALAAQFMTQDEGVATLITDGAAGPQTQAALNANFAAVTDNGAPAVGQGEVLVLADHYGAVGDGSTNDTIAITSALTSVAATGGTVRLTPGRTYAVEQISVRLRQNLEIPAGAKLQRPAASLETRPMIVIDRHHAKVYGGGTIECLNDCPEGIVRVERVGGACEWTRIVDVHINGPGKTTVGSRGLVFNGNSTFQNTARGVTISNVETGVYSGPGANCNHYEGLTLYNIGLVGYHFDTTIESSVIGGSIIGAHDALMFKLTGAAYTRVVGTICEPGGTNARFYEIDTLSDRSLFLGVVANAANTGTDQGARTAFFDGTRFQLEGGSFLTKSLSRADFPTFGSVPANSVLDAVVAVPGAAIGDDATAHPNSLAGLPAGVVAHAVATDADQVTIRLTNITNSSINVPSGASWRVRVWR